MKNKDSDTALKIVESATELFNIYGYSGTSINDIAKKAELSKGILYHYFQNKDELYLYCVKACIKKYDDYLEEKLANPIQKADAVAQNIKYRLSFFDEFPEYRTFFNYIALKKPEHLSKELIEIRESLRHNNAKRVRNMISGMNLGKGIEDEDVVNFASIIQNCSSILLQNELDKEKREEVIEQIARVVRIFNNGLKIDLI